MRVPDVAFETRNDRSDYRDAEFRAGQVHGDNSSDPRRAQLFQLPSEVSTQIICGKARNLREQMRLALPAESVEERVPNIGARRILIFRRRQIVANAGDISQAGLGRLAECPGQRDRPIGMAAGTVEMAQPARFVGRRVSDIANKGGHADIRRDVPNPHVDAGSVVFGQQRQAIRVVDGSDVERPSGSSANSRGAQQRDSIALDQFADRRADRLDQVIARRQPVGAGEKIAVERPRIIGVGDLGRQPARLLPQQIEAATSKRRPVVDNVRGSTTMPSRARSQ